MKLTAIENRMLALVAGVFVVTMLAASIAAAGVSVTFAYASGPADIRVWLDRSSYHPDHSYDVGDEYGDHYEYDVYPTVDDVVLYVRASRDCFATVYVVDTDGFIHVISPLSPTDNAFMRGGMVYKFYLRDAGFYDPSGVAFAYAVSSPVPFSYSRYGFDVFGARFGFRIYGDPYVASREFYFSLLPASCDYRFIGVSYARFYIREYVRYPSYLCVGWHEHYGVRTYCRGDCSAYHFYRLHAGDPYVVLGPTRTLDDHVRDLTRIAHIDAQEGIRYKSSKGNSVEVSQNRVKERGPAKGVRPNDRNVREKSRTTTTVRSSKEAYVKGQSNINVMRQYLKQPAGGKTAAPRTVTKTTNGTALQKGRTAKTTGGGSGKAVTKAPAKNGQGVSAKTAKKTSSAGSSKTGRGKP